MYIDDYTFIRITDGCYWVNLHLPTSLIGQLTRDDLADILDSMLDEFKEVGFQDIYAYLEADIRVDSSSDTYRFNYDTHDQLGDERHDASDERTGVRLPDMTGVPLAQALIGDLVDKIIDDHVSEQNYGNDPAPRIDHRAEASHDKARRLLEKTFGTPPRE